MSKANIVPISDQPATQEESPNRLSFTLEEMLKEFENGAVPRSKFWRELITALYNTANHVITGVTSVADVKPDNIGNIPLLPKDIDAPAMVRMDGADANTQQTNQDVFGRSLFYGDACKVVHQYGAYYEVLAGEAYVAGIRFFYPGMQELLIEEVPNKVWVDVSWPSDSMLDRKPVVNIVLSAEKQSDYVDDSGIIHYLEKSSDILSDLSISDTRKTLNSVSNAGYTHNTLDEAIFDNDKYRQNTKIRSLGGAEFRTAISQVEFDSYPSTAKYKTKSGSLFVLQFDKFINPVWLGAIDNLSIDSTQAFKDALSLKANVIFSGNYAIYEKLTIPDGASLIGIGKNLWDLPSHNVDYTLGQSSLLFNGVGFKDEKIKGLSGMDVSGGSVINSEDGPSSYDLINFTNSDATAIKDSTSKEFSVAVKLGINASLENFSIIPNFRGVDGYNDISETGLADNWDIGVACHNVSFCTLRNVNVVGHWRIAALSQVNVNEGSYRSYAGAIFNRYIDCYFSGQVGVSIRGNDVFRVIASSNSSVTIPTSNQRIFSINGGFFVIRGIEYSYSSANISGNQLTFNNVSPDPAEIAEGSELAYGSNIGVASCTFERCVITDLQHRSRIPGRILNHDNPEAAVQVNGFPVRDVEFTNVHIFASDVIIHAHDVQHINFIKSFFEATGWKKSITGNWEPQGARFLSTALNDGRFESSAGYTDGITIDQSSEFNQFVDFAPVERSSSLTRFSDVGGFRPHSMSFLLNGPYTKEIGWRAYNSPTTICNKFGSTRIVKTAPYTTLFELNNDGILTINSRVGSNLVLNQTVSGNPARIRLNSVDLENPFDIRTTGEKNLDIRTNDVAVSSFTASGNLLHRNDIYTYFDDAATIGRASQRYKEAFLINNPISTFDITETIIDDIPESWFNAADNINQVRFKWISEVERHESRKRLSARWHIGYGAQTAYQECLKAGIENPWEISFMCKDALTTELDDGTVQPLIDEKTGKQKERWGLRISELNTLKIAAIERKLAKLENK